jgi:hypothetical protein
MVADVSMTLAVMGLYWAESVTRPKVAQWAQPSWFSG